MSFTVGATRIRGLAFALALMPAIVQAQVPPAAQVAQGIQATPGTGQAGDGAGIHPAPDREVDKLPLSVEDLQRAFGQKGLSDEELIQSMSATTPLSPDQIRSVRRYIDSIRQATSEPAGPPPKAMVSSRTVSLEPGEMPSVIRMQNGTITSLIFQDATGAPWPVQKVATGNPNWTVDHPAGSNIVMLSPTIEYTHSNISILLDRAPAPVILLLEAGGKKEVDHRVDFVVQGRGPHAVTLSMDMGRTGTAIPDYMIAFQDGVAPEGAERLRHRGLDGVDVWRYKGNLIVRTRASNPAPSPHRAVRAADGTHVYEIPETPVISLLSGGRMVRLSIDI